MATRYNARAAALLLVLVTSLMFAACGGDDSADGSGKDTKTTATKSDAMTTDNSGDKAAAGAQTLELGVDGNNLAFDKTELTAKAGSVTLKLTNDSSIPHNIAIEDADGKQLGDSGELVTSGDTSETTADLKAGTYTYYCDPHKSSGMTGKLVVS